MLSPITLMVLCKRMPRTHRLVASILAVLGVAARGSWVSADVVSCSLNPTTVYGSDSSAGTVVLDVLVFGRLRTINLSSSNPAVASVPASVSVFRDQTLAHFTVTTYPVAVQTNATITATEGGVSKQAVITVRPPALTSVTFSPNSVRGSDNSIATIVINGPAPGNWICAIEGPYPPIYFQSGSIVSFLAGMTSTTKTVNTIALTNEVNALLTVRPPSGQSPSRTVWVPAFAAQRGRWTGRREHRGASAGSGASQMAVLAKRVRKDIEVSVARPCVGSPRSPRRLTPTTKVRRLEY